MVGPRQKKEAVKHVLARGLCSLRRACKYFELHRSTYQYEPKEATEYRHKLVARILVISKTIHVMVIDESALCWSRKVGK